VSEKIRYAARDARIVAEWLVSQLEPGCVRIQIAGSVRRERVEVGDIEIVYVPMVETRPDPADLFGPEISVNLTDERIAVLERANALARRRNRNGSEMFGQCNKFMVHVGSGIPVDLFSTQEACWFNYVVCRTGGMKNNLQIAKAAQRKGWKWNPYGRGFSKGEKCFQVESERDVYGFVGLPWKEPRERQ